MKKFLLLFTAVLTLGVTARAADGDTFGTSDRLTYKVISEENKEVSVESYVGKAATLIIPQQATNGSETYTVAAIGAKAFNKCSSLVSVTIPASVKEIGVCPFMECSNLEEIIVDTENACYTSVDNVLFNKQQTEIIQCPEKKTAYKGPSTVTKIGSYAFYNCKNLTSVVIPGSVTEIGSYAFYNCKYLSSVDIPGSVTEIGSHAFYNCSLVYLTIPGSVTEIKESTFQLCAYLVSVDIPASVTKIDDYAFDHCWRLTSVTIPDAVTEIGTMAFAYCSKLESVHMPSMLTKIDTYAFSDCKCLNSITIPALVTEIGRSAFIGVPLMDIYCYATTPPYLSSGAFSSGTMNEAFLHVQKDAVEAYKEHENWKQFMFIFGDLDTGGIEGIEADGSDAPAEYFDLNGVRVANPENGLYIKRQGGKATKVLVK